MTPRRWRWGGTGPVRRVFPCPSAGDRPTPAASDRLRPPLYRPPDPTGAQGRHSISNAAAEAAVEARSNYRRDWPVGRGSAPVKGPGLGVGGHNQASITQTKLQIHRPEPRRRSYRDEAAVSCDNGLDYRNGYGQAGISQSCSSRLLKQVTSLMKRLRPVVPWRATETNVGSTDVL